MNYWLLGFGLFLIIAVLGLLFALLLLAFLKARKKNGGVKNEDKSIRRRT